jgi:hypothetical protein
LAGTGGGAGSRGGGAWAGGRSGSTTIVVDLPGRVMTAADDGRERKVTRLEILGAWLGVWTPPRDAEIPPIPWRKVGLIALATVVVCGTALALIAPRIDDAKDERSARDQRELAERTALRRAIIRAEQVPRTGRATGDRGQVMQIVAAAVGRDARKRFSTNARAATCEPVPGTDATAARVAFDCHAPIREIVQGGGRTIGSLAIPFRAVVDFDRGRYAFCKVNPPPGEQIIPDPRSVIELPRACRTPAA